MKQNLFDQEYGYQGGYKKWDDYRNRVSSKLSDITITNNINSLLETTKLRYRIGC